MKDYTEGSPLRDDTATIQKSKNSVIPLLGGTSIEVPPLPFSSINNKESMLDPNYVKVHVFKPLANKNTIKHNQ